VARPVGQPASSRPARLFCLSCGPAPAASTSSAGGGRPVGALGGGFQPSHRLFRRPGGGNKRDVPPKAEGMEARKIVPFGRRFVGLAITTSPPMPADAYAYRKRRPCPSDSTGSHLRLPAESDANLNFGAGQIRRGLGAARRRVACGVPAPPVPGSGLGDLCASVVGVRRTLTKRPPALARSLLARRWHVCWHRAWARTRTGPMRKSLGRGPNWSVVALSRRTKSNQPFFFFLSLVTNIYKYLHNRE
jgi:hypothetical protein